MPRYYIYDHAQNVVGPYEAEQVRQQLSAGSISNSTQACAEGTENWMPISSIPELAGPGGGGAPMGGGGMGAAPPVTPIHRDHGPAMPQAGFVAPVLITIFCCLIGGIVSLIYTSKANTAAAGGDQMGYEDAMKIRKLWIIISIVSAVIIPIAYFLLMVVAIGAGSMSGP